MFQKFQITDLKMDGKGMVDHLQAISKEATSTSCTLVTSLGERVEVKFLMFMMKVSQLFKKDFSGAILLVSCNQPILGIPALSGLAELSFYLFG